MGSVRSWDREDGDAQEMASCKNEQFDFVHSSHCLEHMVAPATALENWFRILKPGGYMIVLVPDEDMYEQGVFPSTFNPDHKHTFTVLKKYHSWSTHSYEVFDLIEGLGETTDVIKIERLIGTYRFGLPRQDQTLGPIGEAAIEFVIRKRVSPLKDQPARIMPGHTTYMKARPKIALHRPGAIGDIIMTLSLVPLLKQKYPEHDIHYFCHPTIGRLLTRLMQMAGIDHAFSSDDFVNMKSQYAASFNLIGYPLQDGYPEKKMKRHLIEYFATEMGLIGPHDSYNPFPALSVEPGPHPIEEARHFRYATIHPQAGWSVYKNWPIERWEAVVTACPDIVFYQIGAETDAKIRGVDHRFMGKPLDTSIDLLAHASLHLGIDSWTNHLTNVEWKLRGFTPAIILWGSTQASAAGYPRNVNISLGLDCQPCFREDPKISRMPRGPCINPPGQVYEKPEHACMAGISVERVLQEVERLWLKE
jgi:ADP-heptose:LPS heptosyltransferase